MMNKNQENYINIIDSKLDVLLNKMEYDDYIDFIKTNKYLSTYDDVLGYTDINYLPNAFLSGLTDDFLSKVELIVDNKINELDKEQ